ncbi:hypothetical protein SCG7109_AV_00070 [Chlamydiales bacterium SCGC AG-110-M15]|nr:hypothetical protein SCG7109_AV_00070 [Chlamydiales bacterium SCGC AG-110-M15]
MSSANEECITNQAREFLSNFVKTKRLTKLEILAKPSTELDVLIEGIAGRLFEVFIGPISNDPYCHNAEGKPSFCEYRHYLLSSEAGVVDEISRLIKFQWASKNDCDYLVERGDFFLDEYVFNYSKKIHLPYISEMVIKRLNEFAKRYVECIPRKNRPRILCQSFTQYKFGKKIPLFKLTRIEKAAKRKEFPRIIRKK